MSRLPDHFLTLRTEGTSYEDLCVFLERAAYRIRLGNVVGDRHFNSWPGEQGSYAISHVDPEDGVDRVHTSQMKRLLEMPAPPGLCLEHGYDTDAGMTVMDVVGLAARLQAIRIESMPKPYVSRQTMPEGIAPVYATAIEVAVLQAGVPAMLGRAPNAKDYYAVACCTTKGNLYGDMSWGFISLTPVLKIPDLVQLFNFMRDTARPNKETRHALVSHETAVLIQDARKHRLPVRVHYTPPQ